MCRRRLTTASGLLLLPFVLTTANLALCGEKAGAEQEASARVQKRAEALLEVLRAGQWDKAAPLVITAAGKHDRETRRRLGIPGGATAEAVGEKVGGWFRGVYGRVRPGRVLSVRILGPDREYALVHYKHGDRDAFRMRLVDGEWYYTLDPEVPPRLSNAEVRRRAAAHRDQWVAREKPDEAGLLGRGVIESVERTKEGWHVTFVTRTGQDRPEGRHDYFLHVYLAGDGSLLKVVRGPDLLS